MPPPSPVEYCLLRGGVDLRPTGNVANPEGSHEFEPREPVRFVGASIPNQDRALSELWRVLRPGGELRFYEHVIPDCQPKRLLLQAADHSGLWPRIAGGCHPAGDTAGAIERAGFEIQTSDRLMFAAAPFEPSIPHILGIVVRA